MRWLDRYVVMCVWLSSVRSCVISLVFVFVLSICMYSVCVCSVSRYIFLSLFSWFVRFVLAAVMPFLISAFLSFAMYVLRSLCIHVVRYALSSVVRSFCRYVCL